MSSDIFQKDNTVIQVDSNKVVDVLSEHMCYIFYKLY